MNTAGVVADEVPEQAVLPCAEDPVPLFHMLHGDTVLELADGGGPLTFSSLLNRSVVEPPLNVVLDGRGGLARNMKNLGPLLLHGTEKKRLRLAPDKFCVTLIRDPAHHLGKVFRADGSKATTASISWGQAMTVRCETPEEVAAVYERAGSDPHAALILDYFDGIPVGEPFEVLSTDKMRKAIAKPGDDRADVLGVKRLMRGGRSVCAVTRLKENFSPSVWLVIDRDIDEHTPAEFAALDDAGYFAALSKAMPSIDRVTRVRTLSSSARAIKNGRPIGGKAGHTIVQLADPNAKSMLQNAYRSQAIVTQTAWRVPRNSKIDATKVVGHGWKCLTDDAPLAVGRLLFCGSPVSECADITIADQKCSVEAGPDATFDGFAVKAATSDEVFTASHEAGSAVTMRERSGGAFVFEDEELTVELELETSSNGTLTVREVVALLRKPGAPKKLRCQSPFRESSSFAAFMRLGSGYPVLHDSGTSTTSRLSAIEKCELDYGEFNDSPVVHSTSLTTSESPPVHHDRRALRILSPKDLRDMTPVKWRIHGILPEGGIAVLYGPSGAGKTFVVLWMSLALARGIEWYGRRVNACGILYVAAEGSGGFPGRLAAYAKHQGCNLDDVPFWVVPEAIDLMTSQDLQLVIDAASSRPQMPGLIVLDTLSRNMTGDENSAVDMNKVISGAGRIASATGALVLIVTHTGKDEQRGARGHSSLRAASDTEIYVHRAGGMRLIELTKMRDGSDQLKLGFELEDVSLGANPATGESQSVPVAVPCALRNASSGHAPRPGTWEDIVFRALEAASVDAAFDDVTGVLMKEIHNCVPDAYRAAKGEEMSDTVRERARDSANRAVTSLEKAGLLRRESNRVVRCIDPLSNRISTPQPPHQHHTS